jgi:hypothetical protein
MKFNSLLRIFFFTFAITFSCFGQSATDQGASEPADYLSWSASKAESIGKQARSNGKVGNSLFDLRGIHQDKAINYKLRATLMSPEVIRATARFEQLRNRLTDAETRKLVSEAEAAGDLVVMIELDPNEGSGVIPLDWRAFLQPKDLREGAEGAITGTKSPEFRKIKALTGVVSRDYSYDVFWISFPLVDENLKPTIAAGVSEIELVVGIYGKEGRVSWHLPESVRAKTAAASKK